MVEASAPHLVDSPWDYVSVLTISWLVSPKATIREKAGEATRLGNPRSSFPQCPLGSAGHSCLVGRRMEARKGEPLGPMRSQVP